MNKLFSLGIFGAALGFSFLLQWLLAGSFARLSSDELRAVAVRVNGANRELVKLAPPAHPIHLCIYLDGSAHKVLDDLLESSDDGAVARNISSSLVCKESSDDRVTFGFKIQYVAVNEKGESISSVLFRLADDDFLGGIPILDRVGKVYLRGSADTLARTMERAAFSEGPSSAGVKLCVGTRNTLPEASCAIIEAAMKKLVDRFDSNSAIENSGVLKDKKNIDKVLAAYSVTDITNARRIASLFFGVIQASTITIFLFAGIDALILFVIYVLPKSHVSGGSAIRQDKEPISIGDRMYVASIVGVGVNNVVSRGPAIATLESVRQSLESEAVAKMDGLEMLGDTMLKLAFLGTVYGISVAMFSARSLDSSDPLMRLIAKTEMYSGIGVGFGATLLGIALSIAAAVFRSMLSTTWHKSIDKAYRQVLSILSLTKDSDMLSLGESARKIPVPLPIPGPVPRPAGDDVLSSGIRTLGFLGLLVVVIFVVLVAWVVLRRLGVFGN